MAKTRMIRAEDGHSMMKLVGDCRDLGDDWRAWNKRLLDGLLSLTDSELGIGGELGGAFGPRLIGLSPPLLHGLPGFEIDPARIEDSLRSYNMVPGASRFVTDYGDRLREEDGIALTNSDLYADKEWQRSADMQTCGAACGTDATLLCCRQIGPGEVQDVTLMRERGRRAFSAHDRAIVQVVVAAIAPMMGGSLARFNEPSPAGLSPRARQVLACFLEGDGDKQVAARLGIGAHTVNQYAKRIYRHFDVQSRAELLARWIRRGWKSRFPEEAEEGSGPGRDG